jgi:hypothetical protein
LGWHVTARLYRGPVRNWPTREESRRRRAKAIALRKQGKSYKEIRALVGGSVSSISLWLRDVPVPQEHQLRLRRRKQEAVERTAAALHQRRLIKEARIRREAAAEVGEVSPRDLFIAGVLAYAAEGTKNKPWAGPRGVQFTNSDPDMITLFLRWLDGIGVDRSRVVFRVAIHEYADVDGAIRFWARHVDTTAAGFLPPTLKRHNPKTPRRNVGAAYRGCLVVTVRKSIDLNRRIDGWFRALVARLHGGEREARRPEGAFG